MMPRAKVLLRVNKHYWKKSGESEEVIMQDLTVGKTYIISAGDTFSDDKDVVRNYNAYVWDEPVFKDECVPAINLPDVALPIDEDQVKFTKALAKASKPSRVAEDMTLLADSHEAETFHELRPDLNPDVNPKMACGAAKAPMIALPKIALIQANNVMAGGAHKYGLYNFRESKIDAQTYIGAIERHFQLWADGVDLDEESKQNHLAHIIADCAILLDASIAKNLIDNRSKTGLVAKELKRSAKTFAKYITINPSLAEKQGK